MDKKQRLLLTLAGLVAVNILLAFSSRTLEGSLQWMVLGLMFVLTMLAFRILNQMRADHRKGDDQ